MTLRVLQTLSRSLKLHALISFAHHAFCSALFLLSLQLGVVMIVMRIIEVLKSYRKMPNDKHM